MYPKSVQHKIHFLWRSKETPDCYADWLKLIFGICSKYVFSIFTFSIGSTFTDTKKFSDINYHSQKEENALINMICTELFRDVLSHFVNPANLNLEIESQKSKIKSSHDRQSYLNFFYDLLRKVCNISPHKNGSGNPPNSKDNSIAACIDRIKFKSDEIWSHKGGLLRSNFQDILRNLRHDIVECERQVLGGQLYERRIDDLISSDSDVVNVMDSLLRDTLYIDQGIHSSNNQYFWYASRVWIIYIRFCIFK